MNIGWREGADRDTALCDTETTTLDVNYWKDSGETKNRNVRLHTVDLKAGLRDLNLWIEYSITDGVSFALRTASTAYKHCLHCL